jgi:GNAT superfamily N-acetyltransferase
MAILKYFQGQGLGRKILNYGEILLKEKEVHTVWCNAREVALPFYKQNGYQVLGEPFSIGDIGQHYTMYKLL